MCIVQAMKRSDSVRQLSIVLLLRQVNEWCGLLKISVIGSDDKLRIES